MREVLTRVDRAIATISPRVALRRVRDRASITMLDRFLGSGGYSGASAKRSLKTWNPRARSADEDTIPDLQALRGRSRDLSRNAPLGAGSINNTTTSVVGTGLRVQSSIDAEFLGLEEETARKWERDAERIFRLCAKNIDITREQTFAQQQYLVLRSQLESGDVLALRRFAKRPGDLLGTKIQLVEADRISTPHGREIEENLADGVELDRLGAPTRYWIRNRHPGDTGLLGLRSQFVDEWTSVQAWSRGPLGERNALLVFDRQRPNQHRGVPYLAPVVEILKQLERYTEAEVAAAVVASFFSVFIKSNSDAGLANQNTRGEELAGTGHAGVDDNDRDLRMGPAAVLTLDEGEAIDTANPGRPNQAFNPFVDALFQQVGVALEQPKEVLVKHFQSSYSAARAAILEAWRFFRRRRHLLVLQFCQPVYEWVIAEAVATGLLRAPGFFEDPLARAAWLGTRWDGDPQGHVNPVQEVKAIRERMHAKLISRSQAIAEDSGGDAEQVDRQIARDRARESSLDINDSAPAPAGGGAPPEPPIVGPEPREDE